MKRHLPLLLLLAASFSSSAQKTPRSLLWSISGNGLEASGYLYGTVHSKDERAYTYSRQVEAVMPNMVSVVGELDFTASTKGSLALMGRLMMPDGKKLEDLYTKKEWKEVDAALREKLGFMAGMFSRMKPFFVMATMIEGSMGNDHPEVLDAYLMNVAREQGKQVFGLETMTEQLAAIDVLSLKDQAKALLLQLRQDGTAELDDMLNTYAAQDLDRMLVLMAESPSMPPVLHKSLITDRNLVMAHRMDSVLRVDGPSMFMVGAGHLPGQAGVIALLKERGYTVEAIDMDAMVLPATYAPSLYIADWIHYVNDTLGFRVDMPEVPLMTQSLKTIEIGAKLDEQAVLVMVNELSEEQQNLSLDDLVHQEFGALEGQVVEELVIQGRHARLVSVTVEGINLYSLVLLRGDQAFTLAILAADEGTAHAVLDSFRLADLPE